MLDDIGRMAGEVWKTLDLKGEMSVSALKKGLGSGEVNADWAIGWLARENKIVLRKERNTVKIALRRD
jgi:Winged helix-turn-helix domain (DUF2582)